MADAFPPAERPTSVLNSSEPRRKVRKGTVSCWECKRRKIRCAFSAASETVCNGCKRRGTACISQDSADQPEFLPTVGVRELGLKISRLEALVEQLAGQLAGNTRIATPGNRTLSSSPIAGYDVGDAASLTVLTTNTRPSTSCVKLSNIAGLSHGQQAKKNLWRSSESPEHVGVHEDARRGQAGFHVIYRQFLAIWPSQRDLDILLNIHSGISGLFHGVVCAPYSSFLSQDGLSARELLQLPPPGTHPVLAARICLLLGVFLQSMPRSAMEHLGGKRATHVDFMTRVVQAAYRLVVSKDEMVDSLEGIECIMIYSMYQNNAGDLRAALVSVRRAMGMAQIMGLHRVENMLPMKVVVAETQQRITPGYMWFRLVQTDHYLSLMLGLPPGSADNSFADTERLEECTALERLERLHTLAAGHILQRNQAVLIDTTATQEIDKLLQKASETMQAQWWLPPSPASVSTDEMAAFRESIRITNQFAHYTAIVHLHLPHVLCSSNGIDYDYNKMTAASASRELLSRFVSLSSLSSAYCRGVDFICFIACTVLCLAHIDAHHQRRSRIAKRAKTTSNVFTYLAHHRSRDRGLMEQVSEIMTNVGSDGVDRIATKISYVLNNLLAIEAEAASGSVYSAHASPKSSWEDLECGGSASHDGKTLRIHIPSYGMIHIQHDGTAEEHSSIAGIAANIANDTHGGDLPDTTSYTSEGYAMNRDPDDHLNEAMDSIADSFDWTLQGVDVAIFDSLIRGADATAEDSWT